MVVPVVMFIGNPDGSVTLIQREEEKRWRDTVLLGSSSPVS